jgi:hypothetical protein
MSGIITFHTEGLTINELECNIHKYFSLFIYIKHTAE